MINVMFNSTSVTIFVNLCNTLDPNVGTTFNKVRGGGEWKERRRLHLLPISSTRLTGVKLKTSHP